MQNSTHARKPGFKKRNYNSDRSYVQKDFLTHGSNFGKPRHSQEDRSENYNRAEPKPKVDNRNYNRIENDQPKRPSYGRSNQPRREGFKPRYPQRRGRFNNKKESNIHESKFIKKAVLREEEKYSPQNSFSDFDIHDLLKKNIAKRGFSDPTPIQDKAIPHILQGKDIIGIANTGTGKTAAFTIPLLNKVFQNPSNKVLIVTPTRELAEQIHEDIYHFSKDLRVYAALCIGGADIRRQIAQLSKSNQFVIGTPGRLKDLLNRNVLNLNRFNNLVLDEVDRMLDMGFVDEIKMLISKLPEQRQSLFFSATLSQDIDRLIKTILKDPVTISVKTQETSENIDQDIVRVGPNQRKFEVLEELLKGPDFKKTLIFVKTKIGAERLDNDLYKKGFRVTSIHGDKSQYKRQSSLNLFKQNRANILVATDVAARGLDIKDVSHVINYDKPATYEDYVHRIGRTGRANQKGFALTFVD